MSVARGCAPHIRVSVFRIGPCISGRCLQRQHGAAMPVVMVRREKVIVSSLGAVQPALPQAPFRGVLESA